MSIPVLVLFGQTATGKTELLSHLFSNFSSRSLLAGCAEIVNADSVQVYRSGNVCSALPTQDILNSLPHHLVSFKEPFEEFSVSDFVKAVLCCSMLLGRLEIFTLLILLRPSFWRKTKRW